MAIENQDRPIDLLREEVIDQLIVNYGHGVLSEDAFERRLDSAMASNNASDLSELVADLELEADKRYTEQKREELELDSDNYFGSAPDVEHAINIFGGSNRTGPWSVPREIRMLNLFGGGDIDFTQARFDHPTCTVRMLTLFGGANIYVREDINTVSKTISIFGGTENSAPASQKRNAPVVVVEGLVMFGGVNIEIKRTVKEKFVEFANFFRDLQQPMKNQSGKQQEATPLFGRDRH